MIFTVLFHFLLFHTILAKHSHPQQVLNYRLLCFGDPHNNREPGLLSVTPALFNEMNENYFNNITHISAKNCKRQCFENSSCYSARFTKGRAENSHNGTCFFYDTTLNHEMVLDRDIYFEYKPCYNNSTEVCAPNSNELKLYLTSNRCQGFWVSYPQYEFTASSSLIPFDKKIRDLRNALLLCLEIPSCSGVQLNMGPRGEYDYEFHRDWPAPLIASLKFNQQKSSFIWKCGVCHETLEPPWKLISKSIMPPPNKKYFSTFYTTSSFECREACYNVRKIHNKRRSCNTVFYDNSSYLCILQADKDDDECSSQLNTTEINYGNEMIEYKYKEKLEFSDLQTFNTTPGEYSEEYKKSKKENNCYGFKQNNLMAFEDKCGLPDMESKSFLKKTEYLALIYDNKYRTFFDSITKKQYFLHRFDTGYEYLWLKFKNEDIKIHDIEKKTKTTCEYFSGGILKKYRNKYIPYIPRKIWGALPPKNSTKHTSPAKNVIIQTTVWPKCGCFSVEHCLDEVRSLQSFYMNDRSHSDIPYNFLVTNEGDIIEGTGWSYKGAIYQTYNFDSITIGLIGYFNNESKSPKKPDFQSLNLNALNSLKRFIEQSYLEKRLTSDYILLSKDDVIYYDIESKDLSPTLNAILSNWPHYHKRIKPNHLCNHLILAGSLALCFTVISFVALVGLMFRLGYLHYRSCISIRRILRATIEKSDKIYFSIFPTDLKQFSECFNLPRLSPKLDIQKRPTEQFHLRNCSVFLMHESSTQCQIISHIKQLHRYAGHLNKMDFLQILHESDFLQFCPHKTATLLMQPENPLDPSSLIIYHADIELILYTMLKETICCELCFCRKFAYESCRIDEEDSLDIAMMETLTSSTAQTQHDLLKLSQLGRKRHILNGHEIICEDSLKEVDEKVEESEEY